MKKLFSIAGYIVLGTSSLILILSPFIDFLKDKIPTITLVGIFSGVISYFIEFFGQKAEKIETETAAIAKDIKNLMAQQNQLDFMSLSSAIFLSVGDNKNIENIRIYASTTAVIHPIIRDLKLKVENCKILLQIFADDDPNPNSKELNELCAKMEKKWKEITGIKNLQVVRYNRYPTEYLVIFDDRYLIIGRYSPNDKSEHGSNYFDPIVFSGKELSSKRYIDETIVWYDSIFNYYSNRNLNIIKP